MLRKCCPICGKDNNENKKIFFRDFSGMRDFAPFSHYNVYLCCNCEMIYAGDIEESMPLNTYYSNVSKYERTGWSTSSLVTSLDCNAADYLTQYALRSGSRILDVGCGAGGMLIELKRKGWNEVYGLEPSEKNASMIDKEYGIKVYVGSLGDVINGLYDNMYDVVAMKGVLEHIIDLTYNIKEVIKLLDSEGHLFIEVPDVDQFHYSKNLYQEFSVEHVNFFNLSSLINMFDRFNFKLDSFMQNGAGGIMTLWSRKKDFINEYISNCKTLETLIRRKIQKIESNYYVWGAGTHTAMLYQLGLIDNTKVKGVIDINNNYYGKSFYGKVVEGIQNIDMRIPILISSKDSQQEIVNYILDNKLENPIIRLY